MLFQPDKSHSHDHKLHSHDDKFHSHDDDKLHSHDGKLYQHKIKTKQQQKFISNDSIENGKNHTDSPSDTPNELMEFNHPHDTTGFVPESPMSHWPSPHQGYYNQFADFHEPYFQYGQQLPMSYVNKRKLK